MRKLSVVAGLIWGVICAFVLHCFFENIVGSPFTQSDWFRAWYDWIIFALIYIVPPAIGICSALSDLDWWKTLLLTALGSVLAVIAVFILSFFVYIFSGKASILEIALLLILAGALAGGTIRVIIIIVD